VSTNFTRRAFLGVAATAPLMAAPDGPHVSFPTEARQRLAVTSYPFRAHIDSPTNPARDKSVDGMDLKEFPAMIARRFDVHNINPLGDHLRSTEPAYLKEFRAAVEAAGSRIVDLGLGGRDFGHSEKSIRDEAAAYGRRWIDVALVIGSPSVRQHLRTARGATPSVSNAVESLGRLADYGSQRDVVVNLENDSPGAEDPFFIVEVVGKVSSPYLRALPDFGNSLRGHDAAYNEKAVNAMFQHAYNMSHVKDVLRTQSGEIYRVDVARMFAVARANGYKGYFSMEFDTGSGDPFQGTGHLVSQSLKYM
jgi:sugar phosphate isomerase/epimerase